MKKLLNAKNTAWLFILIVSIFYLAAPIAIYFFVVEDILYLKTAGLALTAICGIAYGRSISLPIFHTDPNGQRIALNRKKVVAWIFFIFITFIVVTLSTAPSIPFLSALQGKDVTEISMERGEFLKGREGGWIVLLYLSSMLSSSIVPYAAILSYEAKSKLRHFFAATYLVFSIIFMVKALFLNIAFPSISYKVEKSAGSLKKIVVPAIAAATLILTMIWLSGYGSLERDYSFSAAEYLTTTYIPSGIFDFFFYRSFAIPIFSVVDTLYVHDTRLHGELLWGMTSSLLAGIADVDKVNVERMVAEYQYGGWNDFANSNVVFFVDGYLNFGWFGVFAFGIFVGHCFRHFANSQDPAFRALSLIFAYQLFSSPLIQMLLSNGWLLLFIIMSRFAVREKIKTPSRVPMSYKKHHPS